MSFLDAFSGYHQIRMHPPDCHDVSFITSDGCYCEIPPPYQGGSRSYAQNRRLTVVLTHRLVDNTTRRSCWLV
ncbi:hypothetical protein KSP40_PGU006323 [Platanthera guangdongensis]|uniref:Transposon Ty3-I Gag-Pol polyprotein n=1 Tax=Platanthera guangdongensis TaxID=2320717 RepID=A0ABR2MKQ9_9ASPA